MQGQDRQPEQVATAVKQALDEKHKFVYAVDPRAASLLRERNWDGAVSEPSLAPGFLMVVDTNLGFNKVDPSIDCSIYYGADLGAESGPRGHLEVTYYNQSRRPVEECMQEARYGEAYADMMDRCYWVYVRVYVPAEARLPSAPDLRTDREFEVLLAAQGKGGP
jgi:hypothetical protein